MLMFIHKFAQLSTHILRYIQVNNIKIDEGERERERVRQKNEIKWKKINLIICLCVHSIQIKYYLLSLNIYIY